MENENITKTNNEILSDENNKKEECCEHKNCKCGLNLVLNIIAIAGIFILFVLYFTGKSGSEISAKKSNKSSLIIGFVNSDTIMSNYNLVKKLRVSLEAKQKEAEDNFSAQQKTFEAQVLEYQKKVKANTLSIEQAQKTEKSLSQKQESLLALKDELTQKLTQEELAMNTVIQDSIINYLKRYNRKHNYDYVLGFSKGSGILIANDSLDLTKEVLDGLNKEYKSE